MNKKWSFILVVGILMVGFVLNVIFSNQSGPKPGQPTNDNSKNYRTMTISVKNYDNSISATGRLEALNKVELYAEVSGVLEQSSSKFKAGNYFEKGQALVSIDDAVYKNNLLAQKSSLLNQLTLLLPDLSFDFPNSVKPWENYLNNFSLEEPLKPLPQTDNPKEKYYLAAKNIYNLYYNVKSMEATWAKYKITAPFSGVVTESNINPGTLVRNGQKLGEFISTDVYEVSVAVNPANVQFLSKGAKVKLVSEDDGKVCTGTINRINAAINQTSQMSEIYVRTNDKNVKDGMYVTAILSGEIIAQAAMIPRSAVNQNDEVYVKNGNDIFKTEVEIISTKGNSVFVRGLKNGTIILAEYSEFTSNGNSQQSVSMN